VKRRRFPVGESPTRRNAPAGSNRSNCGGNETVEASGDQRVTIYGDVASVQAVTLVNAEQVCASSEGWRHSVGNQAHPGKSQDPVAWVDGRKETEPRKPIDKAIRGMVSESSGRNESERGGGLEIMTPEAELSIMERRQHGPLQSDRCGGTLWRGSSDSTMTRICRATGETLLAPSRNRRSRDSYNRRHREIGERREGDGWVRSSGEAE